MTNQERLQLYLDAEAAVLKGQEVRMGERSLKRADLPEIRKGITQLRREIAAEASQRCGGMGSLSYRTAVFD